MAFTTGPIELSRAIENGKVNVVDARLEKHYRSGHKSARRRCSGPNSTTANPPERIETMTRTSARPRPRRTSLALGAAMLCTGTALTITASRAADSTPIGPLPPGPVSTITTRPNQLVAVALPKHQKAGLVWRLARRYDSTVVRQISETDVDTSVVIVFKVTGRGDTSVVFALTNGDTSGKAVKTVTHRIRSQ